MQSGTSPGAHYREAFRAKSTPDFISKMEGALQELDKTAHWLELLVEGGIVDKDVIREVSNGTSEPIAIFVAAVKSAKLK